MKKLTELQKAIRVVDATVGILGGPGSAQEHAWEIVRSAAQENRGDKPTVVCLCGSTRFGEAFRAANLKETLAGRIVLSIGCDFKSDQGLGLTVADKERLDELHLRKIDLASEVLILNVGGYIGNSTSRERDYALSKGKRVRYLEKVAAQKAPAND